MPINLKNRSFLSLLDFTPREIRFLVKLAADLKAAKYAGTERPRLLGKNIALIFEKPSTRTRSGFEVAAFDQGANVTYLGPTGSQIGEKETMKDTARVLGRLYDGIEYRGYGQAVAEELAAHAGVPVWNGLTDEFHPTQILADLLTMREYSHKHLSDVAFCFLGDGADNVAGSLMVGAAKIGMDFRLAAPKRRWPDTDLVARCQAIAEETGARVNLTEEVVEATATVTVVVSGVIVRIASRCFVSCLGAASFATRPEPFLLLLFSGRGDNLGLPRERQPVLQLLVVLRVGALRSQRRRHRLRFVRTDLGDGLGFDRGRRDGVVV